jgi:hypothetical protein
MANTTPPPALRRFGPRYERINIPSDEAVTIPAPARERGVYRSPRGPIFDEPRFVSKRAQVPGWVWVVGGAALVGFGIYLYRRNSGQVGRAVSAISDPPIPRYPVPLVEPAEGYTNWDEMIRDTAGTEGRQFAFFKMIDALNHPSAKKYGPILWKVGQEVGINPFFLAAVLKGESNFGDTLRPLKKGVSYPKSNDDLLKIPKVPPVGGSPKGAGVLYQDLGLMQINYPTHRYILDMKWWDPETNIREGAKILKRTLDRYSARKGTVSPIESGKHAKLLGFKYGSAVPDVRPIPKDLIVPAVFGAYNAGEEAVLWALAAGKDPDIVTYGGQYIADRMVILQEMLNMVGLLPTGVTKDV